MVNLFGKKKAEQPLIGEEKCNCTTNLKTVLSSHNTDPSRYSFCVIMMDKKTDTIGMFAHNGNPEFYDHAIEEIQMRSAKNGDSHAT